MFDAFCCTRVAGVLSYRPKHFVCLSLTQSHRIWKTDHCQCFLLCCGQQRTGRAGLGPVRCATKLGDLPGQEHCQSLRCVPLGLLALREALQLKGPGSLCPAGGPHLLSKTPCFSNLRAGRAASSCDQRLSKFACDKPCSGIKFECRTVQNRGCTSPPGSSERANFAPT